MSEGRTLKVSSHMEAERVKELIECLRENLGAFAWSVEDMPGIDPDYVSPIVDETTSAQKKEVGKKRRQIVDQEVEKFKSVGYAQEMQYPSWLANLVLVQKRNGK